MLEAHTAYQAPTAALPAQVRDLESAGQLAELLLAPRAVEAQQGKVYRIGHLSPGPSEEGLSLASLPAFRQSLRELGYAEGRNLKIELRYAEGDFGRLSSLAAELVRLEVAVIVTWGPGGRSRQGDHEEHPHRYGEHARCRRIRIC